MTWPSSQAHVAERRRRRHRARGVTTVEYALLVTLIFLPSVAIATTGFVYLVGWYEGFVRVVSQPSP